MLLDTLLGLINLLLALITLGIVLRFWWSRRQIGPHQSWWVLVFAVGLFAIAEAVEVGIMLRPGLPAARVGTSVRLFFMAVLIVALYRLFEEVVTAQQRALAEAQETIRLQAESVRQAQETELLASITRNLAGTLDLETVLSELCRQARGLMNADSVSVRLPVATTGGFRFAVDFASALKSLPERLDPAIDELCWKVVQAGRPAIIEDARTHELFGPAAPPWLGALASFPLRRGPDVIGVLTVVYDHSHPIDPRDRRLMAALADHAAVAVYNAQLHGEAELRATTDGLTGLVNRRRFNEVLASEVRRARRYSLPLAVIMADADRLKHFNDTYGHPAGDALLIAVARTLGGLVRATDVPARFGGDEFAVILPETDRGAAESLAERIRQATRDLAIDWEGQILRISLSVGVAAQAGGEVGEAGELLRAADEALYQAKREKGLPEG